MYRSDYVFTSESVSEGHPDKVCDRISDSIVDAFLLMHEDYRVAVETMTTTNRVILAGEVHGVYGLNKDMMIEKARQAIREIGYEQDHFHWKTANIDCYVHEQSSDIAQGINCSSQKKTGAGDQGIIFGYACNETDALMPAPIYFAHRILQKIAQDRHAGKIPDIYPDAKSQLTLRYVNGKPIEATSIVLSTQHTERLSQNDIYDLVVPYIKSCLPDGWIPPKNKIYINPTGRFVIGGPHGDTGLTGRKIIVDTYGGSAPHGGGAFSGKDPTKVDRSAAYAARYLAKNVVASGLAQKCTIQLAYAIGISEPLALYVNNHKTGFVDEIKLSCVLRELMDLSPSGIRQHLKLSRPIYTETSSYGHFGRRPREDGSFSWERTDLVYDLQSVFSVL